jgi:predicted  nucleic acid-binding Zn-ribbon protein
MGATLDALRDLQDIEHQIVDIRKQLQKKQNMVDAHERKISGLQKEIATAQEELRRMQLEFSALDLDVKTRTANVTKAREQLNGVKTNKEYAALLAQLNNDKADLTRAEQRAMEYMQSLEQRQAEIAAKTQQLEAEQSRREELLDQSDQTRQSFANRLGQLEEQWKAAAAKVPADALRTFQRLSERFEGEALVKCEKTHPRRDDYVCGGCYMSLTAEVANALLTRDEVRTCKNCGRILTIERG